jgi:dipeptidase E
VNDFDTMNALLLSNSTMPGTSFFTWPQPYVKDFLDRRKRLVFIPFAAVTFSFDEYTAKVQEVFSPLGFDVVGIHSLSDKLQTLKSAEGILVGGGNTFALLTKMYEESLLLAVRDAVMAGTPYIGWSAGANLGCPTIMTTNDMPVVQPPSFNALGLIPFQINPHYHELKFEGQGGETRKDRLEEFLVKNPDKKVVGLPEGMLLKRVGNSLTLLGTGTAKLYEFQKEIRDLESGEDLSWML